MSPAAQELQCHEVPFHGGKELREQPAPQNPLLLLLLPTGTEGLGTRGHRAVGMERGCSSSVLHIAVLPCDPALLGPRALGTARPGAHGDPGPAAPAPAGRAACREGLGLCLEKRWGLSAPLPGATALATQTKPSRSAEPLGHPQLPKSAFHFHDLPALNLTLSSGLGGSSPEVRLPCPGLTEHTRTGETGGTGEKGQE